MPAKRLTEASFEQNEEVKRVSAWAAILFGLALMILTSVTLWVIFRARGWL